MSVVSHLSQGDTTDIVAKVSHVAYVASRQMKVKRPSRKERRRSTPNTTASLDFSCANHGAQLEK